MLLLDVLIQHAKTSLNRPFSYLYEGSEQIVPGVRVLIPFNRQNLVAYVINVTPTSLTREQLEKSNGFSFQFISSVLDKSPLLSPELMALCDEVASYYLAPKISVLQAMLPPSLKPSYGALKGPKIAYDSYLRVKNEDEEGLTPKQKEALRLVKDSGEVLKKEIGIVLDIALAAS